MLSDVKSLIADVCMCVCVQSLMQDHNYASLVLLTMSSTLFGVWMFLARDSKESMTTWRLNVFRRYGSLHSKREIVVGEHDILVTAGVTIPT